tara:strand:- start:294 stop:443 length:150 start_codon:yes stop_codon:yes gene_type:complete
MNKIVKYNHIKSIFPYRVFPIYQQQKENAEKRKEILIKKENENKISKKK